MTDPADQTEINKSLMEAASKGYLPGVRKALQSGANVNYAELHTFGNKRNSCYSTALGVSAFYGHLHVVQYLVDAGANPYLSFKFFNQKTPVDLAREREHEVVAKYLDLIMKHPKWMDKIDETTGYTPLTYSILNIDHTDTGLQKVQTLIDSGADVCRMDKHRKTPLIYAIEKNKLESLRLAAANGDLVGVQKALEGGADVNFTEVFRDIRGCRYWTALGASAYNGHLQVVQYLIEAGANPYLPIEYMGFTALDFARDTKNEVLVKYLYEIMKHPKWMNKTDEKTGYTPLTNSIFNDYVGLQKVQTLIESGADVCKMDKHRKTPLIYAIQKNKLEVVKLLLDKGAIASGVSALKYAFDLRSNDILKCIFEYEHSMINEVFLDDGSTPLTKAISTCNSEIAKYLIENGADVEKNDLNGNSPLEKALLEMPGVEIAEMLVLKGAQVPKTLKQSYFHIIAEDGNIGVYNVLVKNQWDVNQVDEDGKTALAFSASDENLLLSRLLIENGAKISLAQTEVEAFKKQSSDFNWFIEQTVARKQESCETGQE